MSQSHQWLKTIRSLHLYVGVFMAPALLFFAVTGGLQAFGLHEASRGSSYVPPAWLESLAHLHKKQSLQSPARRKPPPRRGNAAIGPVGSSEAAVSAPPTHKPVRRVPSARAAAPPVKSRNLLPMKIYFALVALSLVTSTLGGLYMAYRFKRNARVITGVLAAGIAVPLLLLLF